jgi:hypothetical protein
MMIAQDCVSDTVISPAVRRSLGTVIPAGESARHQRLIDAPVTATANYFSGFGECWRIEIVREKRLNGIQYPQKR